MREEKLSAIGYPLSARGEMEWGAGERRDGEAGDSSWRSTLMGAVAPEVNPACLPRLRHTDNRPWMKKCDGSISAADSRCHPW